MRYVDEKTGEIKEAKIRGLWSHFPIPAYQVLAAQKEWSAQKLLSCLVSYLGKGNLCVYPSYITITKRCGLSPNTIRKALDVLEDNGFIKVFQFTQGKKARNKYYFQECCWDSGKMNKKALASRIPTHKCLDCGKLMDRGGFGTGPLGKVHWGCGGSVVSLNASEAARKKSYPVPDVNGTYLPVTELEH
jgi:hypothetical protein